MAQTPFIIQEFPRERSQNRFKSDSAQKAKVVKHHVDISHLQYTAYPTLWGCTI